MDVYYTLLVCGFSVIIVVIVSLNLILGKASKKKRSNKLPPTPPSLPIVGHLQYLLAKTPFHRTAERLSREYGPVVGLLFGFRRVVLISSPAAVEECFTKNDVVLANRPRLLMGQHVGYNCTTVSTAPYGDHWRNLRRVAAIEIFSAARLRAFAGIRRDEIRRMLVKLYDSRGRGPVDMKSLFSETTFNIIMRMAAGKRYYGDDVAEEEAVRFREIMKEAVVSAGVANPADFLPFMKWFGGGGEGYERKVRRIAKSTDSFLQGLVDEVRTKRQEENTIIHHLLSLQDSQPEYYTDQIIKGLILILLLAGTDTSSVTLEWAMSNLLNHPDVANKAKAEIDSKVGEQQLVEESDLSKLDYLQSIISETLRLYPAAPLLVPHYSSEDLTVGGYHVPRDTIVLVNAWSMHRDPSLWDEPESFKPERFRGGDLDLTGSSYKLVPFGLGRRACPGAGLAQRVVGVALGTLIQCFEWERVSEGLVDMSESRGITLQKAVPLKAKCKPRPMFMNVVLSQSQDDVMM